MLRFPNPGSDIDSFIRIYRELFEALRERASFGLDDMSGVLVERNLATSSGYMGEEALRRSYNQDRSRDALYNQSKMYSELYKVLGWIHPLPESALHFRFTYLGAHVVAAQRDPAALFRESILGIAYPNAVLNVRGEHILRPFATILRTIGALGGLLCRDEMIVGPLCLENDTDDEKFDSMIHMLHSLRGDWRRLESRLNKVSQERGISTTTMENYTRFPLAVLKWLGWTESQRNRDVYGRSIVFLVLTSEGEEAIREVEACHDVRAADLESLNEETRYAIARIGLYQMLERAGFDIEPVHDVLARDMKQAAPYLGDTLRPLLFSPFQELSPTLSSGLFPTVSGTREATASRLDAVVPVSLLPRLSSTVALSVSDAHTHLDVDPTLVGMLQTASLKVGSDLFDIASYIAEMQRTANKDEFYPLIARLFRALGYTCEHSRPGVNYQRWDALIIDSHYSIPIEIKSPGEEEFLSVKAVRQALENKVILLSRKPYPTHPNTTSLVVGYNLPNDRSEVASLVADIYKAFGIIIGIIDLRSLVYLVAATVLQGKHHDVEQLRGLHGIIDVADI